MPEQPEPPDRPVGPPPREAVQRWRIVFARAPLDGEAGQREQLAAWEAALADCGLPIAGLDATPRRPRFVSAAPLSAAIPGEAELVDVWLTERLPAWRVREVLGRSLPAGHTLADVHDVWLGAPALPGQVSASVYRVTFAAGSVDGSALGDACDALLQSDALPRQRKKGQGSVTYDLRPFLEAFAVEPGIGGGAAPTAPRDGRPGESGTVELVMTLRHDPERGVGRPEEVLLALGEQLGTAMEPVVLVRASLVLAPPPPNPMAPPRGPRPRGRRPTAESSPPRNSG